MNKKNWSNIVSVIARTALAFAFVFGQTAWAMQGQNGKDKPVSNAAARPQQTPPNVSTPGSKAQPAEEETATAGNSSAEEKSHGGPHEGIKVHGHWTIEVRDPDGTVVTHREFENSYSPSNFLAQVLARQASVGPWEVVIGGSGCTFSNNSSCSIVEPSIAPLGSSATLVVNTSGNSFVLSGTITAPNTGTTAFVETIQYSCGPTIAPSAACAPVNPNNQQFFTTAYPNPSINVTAGQTIAVTVNISFS